MPVQPFESVTVTTIGKLPLCVGVPESTPADDSVTPAGSEPDAVNVAVRRVDAPRGRVDLVPAMMDAD